MMSAAKLPPFRAPFAPPDADLAADFLDDATRDNAAENRIDARARRLVEAIRARAGGLGGVEDFLHAYSLSTKEGLALMVLAEALLRVPELGNCRPPDRGQARRRPMARKRREIDGDPGFSLSVDARPCGSDHPSGRDAGDDPRQCRQAAWATGDAYGDTPGDAADRVALRPWSDHRRGAGAGEEPRRISLFVRHAWRGRPHRSRRRQILGGVRCSNCSHRRQCRQRDAAVAAGHLGQALGAASAL